jgi:PPP family 3-phenylpropionic acid transporter
MATAGTTTTASTTAGGTYEERLAYAGERLNLRGAMWRYCVQSGLYWVAWCPIAYASTYLLGRGMAPTLVGTVLALGSLCSLFIQPPIALTADGGGTTSIRTLAVALASGITVSFAIALFTHNVIAMSACIVFGLMLAQNLSALSNAVSVYYVNRGAKMNYGLARGIGSASWSLTSLVIGTLTAAYGTDAIMWLALGTNIAMTLGFMMLPTPKDVPPVTCEDVSAAEEAIEERECSGGQSYVGFLKGHKNFLLVVLGFSMCFVMGNIIMSYVLPIMRRVGGGPQEMGVALAISAMSELPAMFSMQALQRRIPTARILSVAAVGYVAKHLVIVFATSIGMLYLGYGLQMVSYAIYTPCSVYYCNQHFGEGDKNKAIGLMVMVNPISAMVGNFAGGLLTDVFGVGAALVFGLALSIVGAVVALAGLMPELRAERA